MSRGVRVMGALVFVSGVWAAVAPYIWPALSSSSTGAAAWVWTNARWQIGLAPGALAAVAGLTLVAGGSVEAWFAKLFAYVAGVWLVLAPTVAGLWLAPSGAAVETVRTTAHSVQIVACSLAPGLVIVTAAALAAGRRRGAAAVVAEHPELAADPLPVGDWA